MTGEHFKQFILLFTLLHEGGYISSPNDRGGETYRGISRKNNPDWEGWPIIDGLKPLKRGDIINHPGLKEAIARLYFEKYFRANGFDRINSPIVALTLFDMAVNGGYSVRMVQNLLNAAFRMGLTPDGVLGVKTLTAINAAPPLELCTEVNRYRSERFRRIAEDDPTQEVFLEGWLTRVRKLNEYIRKA